MAFKPNGKMLLIHAQSIRFTTEISIEQICTECLLKNKMTIDLTLQLILRGSFLHCFFAYYLFVLLKSSCCFVYGKKKGGKVFCVATFHSGKTT